MHSTSTQTPTSLSYATPRKRVQLKSAKRRLVHTSNPSVAESECTLQDFNKMVDKFLNKPLAEIIKAQGTLEKKKSTARRYTMEYKTFALSLYFLGPQAYKFLSKLLYLPSKRTLQRITENLSCGVGLENESIFKAIKIKVSAMLEQDRH